MNYVIEDDWKVHKVVMKLDSGKYWKILNWKIYTYAYERYILEID